MKALDTFAGAGGWDLAARPLGWEIDRVENWAPANATARAAGFGDPVALDVRDFHTEPGKYDLHISSPSCKKWSPAGDGSGRSSLTVVLQAIRAMADGRVPDLSGLDPDAALILEPFRLVLEGMPRAIAWEQSDRCIKVWQHCAHELREMGYAVWTGVVDAAYFGVPQNRKRAVLLARRDAGTVTGPFPTHGINAVRWATMGEALGWPDNTYIVSNYGTGGDPKKRGVRWATQPSFAITSKADRMKVWYAEAPGRNTLRGNLTRAEAALLQTFPADHPWQGDATEVGQQIGNAVPVRLAQALLKELLP